MSNQSQETAAENREQFTVVAAPVLTAKPVSGSFLRGEQPADAILTPEEATEEHRQIARLTREFVQNEIVPAVDRIEQKDTSLIQQLIRRACDIGIGNVDIAKAYGGSGRGIRASVVVSSNLSASDSFSASFSVHTVLGTLPIVYFGTREQKEKYLRKLAAGEWIAAFALSEPGAGSDVLNISARGTLSADGTEWILNAEKAWVTNGSFADVYIVFARIDGDKFSAFIVERSFPGLQIGQEQDKLSARGTSTCSLILKNCRVPRENLLGTIAKGHVVAFNTLNVGRLKVAAASISSASNSLESAAAYARQRKAFNRTLAEFGCIKEKIAWMAAGIYCGESMLYRTVGVLEVAFGQIKEASAESSELFARAIEECAAECSILKVWGSELQQYAADETLQVFGGAGFVEGHPAERAYRDARLNRICQGTNEINRLIIAVWLVKRAINGELRLGYLLRKVTDEVMMGPQRSEPLDGMMAAERELVENARKATLMVAAVIWEKYGMALVDQQEIITAFADMLIENYAVDCVVLRTQKGAGRNLGRPVGLALAMCHLCLARSLGKIEASARKVIAALVEDGMLDRYLRMLGHLFNHKPFNTIALSRRIADEVLENGKDDHLIGDRNLTSCADNHSSQ